MKTNLFVTILMASFTAGLVVCAADDDVSAVADTNMPAEAFPTNGIVLNFHNVPLNAVLNYLSAKAGLIIVSDANLQGSVSVVAKQSIGTNDIVDLLNEQLSKNNLTAVLEGRTLRVMDAERAKSLASTPVRTAKGPAEVVNNDEIVTEILPVNTLKPEQLLKDLETLIPKTATVSANEAGSAIIMTAPGRDIHRISEIIAALDTSAVSDVEVFPLKYADAKSVSAELKEIFQSADSDVTRAGTRNNFGGPGGPGGGMGFGFPGGGGGGSEDSTKSAATHAVFVSDDQMNAIVAKRAAGLHAHHPQNDRRSRSTEPGHYRNQGLPTEARRPGGGCGRTVQSVSIEQCELRPEQPVNGISIQPVSAAVIGRFRQECAHETPVHRACCGRSPHRIRHRDRVQGRDGGDQRHDCRFG